jgi:hypothetical protein
MTSWQGRGRTRAGHCPLNRRCRDAATVTIMDGNRSSPPRRTADPSALDAARLTCERLGGALPDNLLAVYLHGSAVLGGYRSDRSDLDILVLTARALGDGDSDAVLASLVDVAYPAKGLEMTIITEAEAAQPDAHAPRFQLHVAIDGLGSVTRVVDGRDREGDRDLVLHFAVCRASGVALVGPPPGETLALIRDQQVRQAMLDEMAWAATAPPEYLVLTSARAWLFAATGRLASKIEAGEWATERYPSPGVIRSALAVQRGRASDVDPLATAGFARYVAELVGRSARG